MARGNSRADSELAPAAKRKTVEQKVADAILADPSLSIGKGIMGDFIIVKEGGVTGSFSANVQTTNDPNGWSYMNFEGIKGKVKGIYLQKIESDQPGGGNLALRKVIELSEKFNLPVFLTPLPFGGKGKLTAEQLTDWYARNGFKQIPMPWYHTGSNRMIRLPTKYGKPLDEVLKKLPPKFES